jgi:ABC-type sugar transport system ATPase subunit
VGVTKYFGGVQALVDVSLELRPAEVVCLVGDNGAGKSTLTKVIGGQLRADAGELWIEGRRYRQLSPGKALGLGIATVPQALALCDNLGASQNVLLGREPVWFRFGPLKFTHSRRARELALERIREVGVAIPSLDTPVRRLSGGQRQAIAIARATMSGKTLVIFDEPTAALGVRQTQATLDLVRKVAARGAAVMVISHNVRDVMSVADRIVGISLGEVIMDKMIDDVSEAEVTRAMTFHRQQQS